MSEFSVLIAIFLFPLPIESYVEFLPISRMATFSSGSIASARPCRAEADDCKLGRSVRRDADWPQLVTASREAIMVSLVLWIQRSLRSSPHLKRDTVQRDWW